VAEERRANARLIAAAPQLLEALLAGSIALDDWLNTYAAEMCDPERVREANERIHDHGGTLAYIADLQQQIRSAISAAAGAP